MANNTRKTKETITKQEAVRRALAELGRDAKPRMIQGWVKEKYGIAMSTDHISTAKGQILRKAGGKRKSPAITPAATAQPAAARHGPASQGNGFSLDDIEAVKGLVGRVGADGLKKLIEMLAR